MAKIKSKTTETGAPLGELVERLGPINNKCRTAEGIEKVELLWDLGDSLLEIAPDANDQLLRSIHEHSYITRDILRYGLIIRRGWDNRSALRKQFPKLSRYSLFREALPFLKGDRCGIDDSVFANIISQLNSADAGNAKEFLKRLKKERIGRQHKKGQAVVRMSESVTALRGAFKQLVALVEDQPDQLIQLAERIGHRDVLQLSQFCVALADNAPLPSIPKIGAGLEPVASVGLALTAIQSVSREDQNGFRKAVGAVTLMELADLLNALRSSEQINQWQKRQQLKLTL
jgi:hypothetical protein